MLPQHIRHLERLITSTECAQIRSFIAMCRLVPLEMPRLQELHFAVFTLKIPNVLMPLHVIIELLPGLKGFAAQMAHIW